VDSYPAIAFGIDLHLTSTAEGGRSGPLLNVAEAGFVTGPPLPTSDGRLVLTEHGLALLEYVPGRELEGETDEEQRWIASTLGWRPPRR